MDNNNINYIAFDFVEENNNEISPENVDVEIIALDQYRIAEYKFDNTNSVVPVFNNGFTYTYKDTVEDEVTTRVIYSYSLPTIIKFYTTGRNVTEIIYLNMSQINNLSEMFCGCQLLTKVPENISCWGDTKTGNTYSMFDTCDKLCNKQLIMNNWVITGSDMTFIVSGTLVEKISVNNWDFTNMINDDVYAASFMEKNSRLKKVDMENWNVSQLAYFDFYEAFKDCVSLRQVNMKGLTFGNNENIYLTRTYNNEFVTPFTNCPLLDYIDLQDADISAINGIISVLPDRTGQIPGTILVSKNTDTNINIDIAKSRNWNITNLKRYKVHLITVNNKKVNKVHNLNKKLKISFYK